MSVERVFVDTNIFVYAKLQTPQTLAKHQRAVQFLGTLSAPVVVSVQVLNEFSSVLLKHKSEDLQHRQIIDDTLHIINPFMR